jgi:hypothetical protein
MRHDPYLNSSCYLPYFAVKLTGGLVIPTVGRNPGWLVEPEAEGDSSSPTRRNDGAAIFLLW